MITEPELLARAVDHGSPAAPAPPAVDPQHEPGAEPAPGPGPAERATTPMARVRSWRARAVRVTLVVVLLASVVVARSLFGALTAPGTDGVAARVGGWLRDHGGGPIVNLAERLSYTPPKVGGAPACLVVVDPGNRNGGDSSGSLPRLGPPLPPPAGPRPALYGPMLPGVVETPRPPPPPTGPTPLPPPDPVPPVAGGVADEGAWQVVETAAGVPVLRATYVRADAVYTSYLSAVAWMDTHLLRFELHPGTGEPGGGPWPAGASLPPSERGDVVAAFNSAFRMGDSRGGFYLGGRTVGTMRAGAATIAFYNDGSVNVGEWGRDVQGTPELLGARQNLDLIVDGGEVNARINDNSGNRWGATLGNDLYVWRSGVGVTASGALIYAAGPRLSAATLAQLLARAGAARAMELDINPQWTTFVHYSGGGATADKLLPTMQRPATLYDTTSSRDFIAARVR